MPFVIGMTILVVSTVVLANYVMTVSRDTTPPAAVTDLSLEFPTNSSVELRWTATGDDGNIGIAAQYDIRYSLTPIDTDENFTQATQCQDELAPTAPGTVQTYTVTNLTNNTTYYFALKTADEIPNWSLLSNSPSITLEGVDTIPPAAVTDLSLEFPTNSSVELRWTAPGDNGNNGTAAQYDIRHASSVIDTDAKFNAATPCMDEPVPTAAGTVQTYNVTNLTRDSIRYFAMKTADEVLNWSPLSNSVGIPPDFTLDDTNYSAWNLYTHIRNAKPILLQFIHPDCSACVIATYPLVEIYNNYSPGLELISLAVTMDIPGFQNPPTMDMLIDFKTQYSTNWTYLVETSGTHVRDLYGIISVPKFLLLGKDGRITYVQIGVDSMENLIVEIEKALLP